MKFFMLVLLLCFYSLCFAQNYRLPDGDYMDTTISSIVFPCQEKNVYYYQIGGKYPESSSMILKKAKNFLAPYCKLPLFPLHLKV